jgi:hypothetical protein
MKTGHTRIDFSNVFWLPAVHPVLKSSPIFSRFNARQGAWCPEAPQDTVLSTCSSLITALHVLVAQFSHFSVTEYLAPIRITEGRVLR